jgi:hypothetical protein
MSIKIRNLKIIKHTNNHENFENNKPINTMNLVTKWKLFEPEREKPLLGANPEINPL